MCFNFQIFIVFPLFVLNFEFCIHLFLHLNPIYQCRIVSLAISRLHIYTVFIPSIQYIQIESTNSLLLLLFFTIYFVFFILDSSFLQIKCSLVLFFINVLLLRFTNFICHSFFFLYSLRAIPSKIRL